MMKKVSLLVAGMMMAAGLAQAAVGFQEAPPAEENPFDLMCFVVAQEVTAMVGMQVNREAEAAQDILVVYLRDGEEVKGYAAILDKGGFETAVTGGEINSMLMGEAFAQENGVLRDTAMLNIKLNELSDIFEGFIVAKGNLYPLVCPLATLKPAPAPAPTEPTPGAGDAAPVEPAQPGESVDGSAQ